MLRNNCFGETKTHYKSYKCGKTWAVMGISVCSLALGMLVTSQPVSADVAATSTSGDATFPAVVSPVVPGYVAEKAQVAAVTVNADSPDVNEIVKYTKVGSLVPSSSDGNFPKTPTVVYPNDPSDATKVTPARVPTVQGYTAHDPEGNVLTPGSSYQPSDPTKDTTITYTADKQTVKPVNPSQPTTPAKPVQAGQAAATNFVDQRLPQTGETDQQYMTLSGLLLLAMSSVLGLFGMTKRQRKE